MENQLFEYFNNCDEGYTRFEHSAMDILDAAQDCGIDLSDHDDRQLAALAMRINQLLAARD